MASDLPTDVPTLHQRLTTARQKYAELQAANRRLISELAFEKDLRCRLDTLVHQLAGVIRGDRIEGDHPLLKEAAELVFLASDEVTGQMMAGHRLDLVRQTLAVLGLLPRPLPELMETIGGKQEATRLLAQLRAELSTEDPR